ncbi:hypothetical protein A2753_00030 [Candidatus Uhrbacteria bacterium RIFCSPHIGHO2_01_FULL_47_11]|nr:MAG: hypothetical protein A2753_00030 [Candidatus Uhrbacteria bacterium RIFCSPHIGHO2_01_FULL_47_11]
MKRIAFQIAKYFVFGALYFSGLSALYRLCTTQRLRILCYHRISTHASDPLLDVPMERFRAQMQHLKRHYIPLPLSLMIDHVRRTPHRKDKPPVAVTFDDGTTDWFTRAMPILEETQIPATFFVCTGYIGNGLIPYPNPHTPATALSYDELVKLAASSFVEIGGHTLTHPHLSELDAKTSYKEIEGSRALLSSWLKREVALFAYPFGDAQDYTNETLELVREAGYRAACTLDERTFGPHEDPYALPRLVIFDEPLWMFKVRISGVFDDVLVFILLLKKFINP